MGAQYFEGLGRRKEATARVPTRLLLNRSRLQAARGARYGQAETAPPSLRNGPRERVKSFLWVAMLRLYYGVEESRFEVVINAIGIKVREKVFIGGEEIDL